MYCIVALIPFLILICMPPIYACVPSCGKEFGKSFSLVQHKQSCVVALEIRKKSQQIRNDKGADAFPEDISPSLPGRKQRLKVDCFIMFRHLLKLLIALNCIGFIPAHILR
jgi:hypothetical protein